MLFRSQLTIEVTCSKGTYIRALARDIAAALGTVGHLAELTRTRVGPFCLGDALPLDDLETRGVASALLTPACAVAGAPTLTVTAEQRRRLVNGQAVELTSLRADAVWVYDPEHRLLCLASADGQMLRTRILL